MLTRCIFRENNAARLGSFMKDLDLEVLNMVVYKECFANSTVRQEIFEPYLFQTNGTINAVVAYNWDGGERLALACL